MTAGAILLSVAAAWLLRLRPRAALGETDLVLVSDFVNTTGDPIFDDTLKQAVTVKLAESPYFNLLPEPKIKETLGLMGRSAGDRVVPPVAREVCQRAGAKVAVGGTIFGLGSKYVIDVDATKCLTGESLAHERIEAAGRDQVLKSLGEAIRPLRRKLGESLPSIRKFDTPIEQATTTSLAALKAYTEGDARRMVGRQEQESIPYYKLAIDLDPNFAMAYAKLGAVYNRNPMNWELGGEYQRKAFERREHTTERERFYIVTHYYDDSTKEFDKSVETYRFWTEVYPRDWIPFHNLSYMLYRLGRVNEAIAPAQKALQLNPDIMHTYRMLCRAYLRAGRFAEATTICEKALEKWNASEDIHSALHDIALARSDEAALQRQLEWYKGEPNPDNLIYEGWAAFGGGQVRKARELFERSRMETIRQGAPENAPMSIGNVAILDFLTGHEAKARAEADLALRQTGSMVTNLHPGCAFLFASMGDERRAMAIMNSVTKRFPSATLLNNFTLPAIRGALALGRRNPGGAIEELRRSVPYDLSQLDDIPEGATIYLQGMAYLQLHSAKEATAEFQKILNSPGVFFVSPYRSLARLQLARVYAMMGDTDKSLAAYRELLQVWKNGDSDFGPLKEAKAEYAKLGGHM